MRNQFAALIHVNRTRLALERAEADGTATPEQLARLRKIRSDLIDGLLAEVTYLGREVANLTVRSRRPYPFGG